MRILFDACTSPDILLFDSLANEMKKRVEILFTTYEFSQNVQLLKTKEIPFYVVGKHRGKNTVKKIFGNSSRGYFFLNYLRKYRPDICISRSPSAIIPSYLLHIPSVIFADNEKARTGLRFSLPFVSKTLAPRAIPKDELTRFLCNPKKIYFYDGIEEMIYLSDFMPNKDILSKLNLISHTKIIVMRPESYVAQYFHGEKGLLKPVIQELCMQHQIVVLTRDDDQRKEYLREFGKKIIIPPHPIDAPSLLYYADLFIGAHGTMSREAWVLGTPVISMYSGEQLAVEKYLINKSNRYYHTTDPKEVVNIYANLIKKKGKRVRNMKLKKQIIEQILDVCN